MILALDTSTSTCRVWLIDDDSRQSYEWEAARELADGLIGYLRGLLTSQGKEWHDISAIAVNQGPGSFTGLRIGLTVMNTIADTTSTPIVGESGDDWLSRALERLKNGENDGLVMPVYGREPNITRPRK